MDKTRDAKNVSLKATKKPKKHRHIFMWVSLSLTFAIVVAPIALIYGLFYDGERHPINRRENFITETFMRQKTVSSLDNTEKTGKMSFTITSDDLNQMVISGLDLIHDTSPRVGKFLTGLSLETTNSGYNFVADIDIKPIFKTRIRLCTDIKETKLDGKDAVIFSVSNIKVGRVGGIQNGLKRALPGVINDDLVGKVIQNIGFSLVSDMANDRIYYLKESLYNDITNIIKPTEGIYERMLLQFFKDKSFDVSFTKDGVDSYIDLSKYSPNDEYLTPDKEQYFDFKDLNKKAASLITAGIFNPENASDLIVFLIKGYERVKDEFKEIVKVKDLSSIGIDDPTQYDGVVEKYEKDLYTNIKEQITPEGVATKKIGLITEELLNETLQSSSMIGTSYLFDGYNENGNYKINTFVVNNFYANILEDGIKFVIGISANGYPTHICLKATFVESNPEFEIYFKVNKEDIYFGEKPIGDEFADQVFAIFADALKTDETVTFDPTNSEFVVHYGKSVEDSFTGAATAIYSVGTPSVELEGSSLEDDGVVNLVITPEE